MKNFLAEFKAFAMRGNVIDLAVGVIIGGAFGKIVSSVINDVVMPPIGLVLGGVDFKDLKILLKAGEGGAEPVFLSIGLFINTVIEFLIIAFVIFLAIKGINQLVKKEPEAPKAPAEDIVLLTEIRDLLKNKQ
ncbi:MAG: large-conductance mechanosensitive channel protein MscL [Ignavibacteriales bacterium]|jgi:large conductance mechanosensitive channel protein|nr:MAG: large-conductance mechanosensitive channel protein MscL [Ignavibacteriaceae bacterium]MBW7873700.1 large-conductance mechanosensitive channel protein MscL [Ignavibacteria bacterium]MCZ2143925.1 large-conductance mechanosensitive channel protein MscL [Ignavibacteriales bacterium]OQY78271.1 MAG: large-conductance mechanosensitive channel [Ignavibacteriales bacterium UTCHB3]MBV6444601.1 Large-conductance mechanosensitive channel [Ignavibacteriaceae bacterium]